MKNKGFTLVEVLVAMAILAVLLTAFGKLYLDSMKAHKDSSIQMDVNSRLRFLQRIFASDLQELGFGEKLISERSAIHPLAITDSTSYTLEICIPQVITHLKSLASSGMSTLNVLDSANLNKYSKAALISAQNAMKVTIQSVSGENVYISQALNANYNALSRLVAYSSVKYVWNKSTKVLERYIDNVQTNSWEHVETFQVTFYNNKDIIITNPSNPEAGKNMAYVQTEILIKDNKSAQASFRTPLLNINNFTPENN